VEQNTIAAVDNVFLYIIGFCVVFFILIMFFTIFFVVRYRRSKNRTPADIGGNWKLEAAFIAASVVIALSMFYYGLTGFRILRTAPAGAMNVQVVGEQWDWEFTYDNGKTSTDLVVPLGSDVALTMTTPDVIHGFFAPAYRIKQDIVPGMKNRVWFKAETLGSTDILCTQYCGEEHSKMLAKIAVVSPADFAIWYKGGTIQIPGVKDADQGTN
jgi:cytochrome c oxidase subunit 2